jgi:cytochrome c-type biogenesis protein CcmH/NrfG
VFTAVLHWEQVQRKPDNVDAWRLLGTVHAENDDDTQAIAAMAHALKADPTNAEVGRCVSFNESCLC